MESLLEKTAFTFQITLKTLTPPLYSFCRLENFCKQRIERNQTACLPRQFLAHLYKDYGKYREAKHEFEKLHELGYKNDTTHKALGEIYYLLKEYPKAVACLEAIADRLGGDRLASCILGMSYTYTKHYEKGLDFLLQAANLPAKAKKGLLYKLGRRHFSEIEPGLLSEAIGLCYFQVAQFDRSFEWYKKALSFESSGPKSLELRSSAASALVQLAKTLLAKGETQEAIDRLKMARDLSPEDSILQAITLSLKRLGQEG